MCLKGSDCLENYELDPAWYLIAPGLAWDAALKVINVELELLKDPEMLMIEKGIRGGISMISNRFARVNDKYMCEAYMKQSQRNTSLSLTRRCPRMQRMNFKLMNNSFFRKYYGKHQE